MLEFARDAIGVVDDDLVAALCLGAQRFADELVDVLEVRFRTLRSGENEREGNVRVGRVEQDAEQVENLLRRADAAGEDDDAMAHADEGFEPFSISGKMTSSLQIGFGASAAMMPGSVKPM